jgi:hypothetical protein
MVFFSKQSVFYLLAGCLVLSLPTAAAIELPTVCEGDIKHVRQSGVTNYTETPITIISQDSTSVSFKLTQKWATGANENLQYLFARYKNTTSSGPGNCQSFNEETTDKNSTWESPPLTAYCTKNSKLAIVELWVSDAGFDDADNATLPDCGCGEEYNLEKVVKYLFTVKCESACPTGCFHVSPTTSPTDSQAPSINPSSSPSNAPSSSPSNAPSSSPSQEPTAEPECEFEGSLHAVCKSFAVHATTTMTFASGEETRIVGDIGVNPGTSITGKFEIKPGGTNQGNDAVSKDYSEFMWGSVAPVVAAAGTSGEFAARFGGQVTNSTYQLTGTVAAYNLGDRATYYPGVYRALAAINFAGAGSTVTLDGMGDEDAEFVFIAGTTLITAANTFFILQNGAKAENILWVLGTAATLGANSILEGSILAGTAITVGTAAELRGCVIALTAVTFETRGYVNVKDQSTSPPCYAPGRDVCENFAVHARTTITFAGTADQNLKIIRNGDIGVSPGTSITGKNIMTFVGGGEEHSGNSLFSTSAMFHHANLLSPRHDETYWGVGVANIAGAPLSVPINGTYTPGVYRSGSAIDFPFGTTVTLDAEGDEDAVFLFQAFTTLVTAADTYFNLINGAKAENIIWALGTGATLGANSTVEGSILAGTAITVGDEAKINGCAIAMTAVTFEGKFEVDLGIDLDLEYPPSS